MKEGLDLSRKINSFYDIKSSYLFLSETYARMNDFKNAYEYHKFFSEVKDSMLNEESSKQIAEMQTKYETEKKDSEIKLLSKDKSIQDEELKRQKIFIYSAIAVVLLVLTLAFFIYRSNKQKQLANLQLEKKNAEILQTKTEIENKNQELQNANHEITKKKKEIEEKNEEVLSSIRYAKRIQNAVLKAEKKVTAHLPDHFVLFKPKDIVSGDFYWAVEKRVGSSELAAGSKNSELRTNNSELIWYVAAADCTGHGVPGAFLTMLGMSFLNEITAGEKILKPSEILDELRNRIIKELGQTGKDGESKDGMDISLMALNLNSNELEWAGANNSLNLICRGELKEIKADKQPVGYFPDTKPFNNHKIQLQKNDCIYIFSDGYADQFGGPKGKKFKYSQLENLIVSIQNEPMESQREILNNTMENWKGNLEQIDDICVIGIRI